MTAPIHQVPDWPLIRIELSPDPHTGQPRLTVAGEPIDIPPGHDPRLLGVAAAAGAAKRLHSPVRAIAIDAGHEWPLIVYPDGSTTDPDATPPRQVRSDQSPRWRLPAGLGIGIGGLVLLVGLATSMIVIKPTAEHTPVPPAPPAPGPTSVIAAPAPRRPHTPPAAPPALPSSSAAPDSSVWTTAAPPHPSPTITFGAPTPSRQVKPTPANPTPKRPPAPSRPETTPTTTKTPRQTQTPTTVTVTESPRTTAQPAPPSATQATRQPQAFWGTGLAHLSNDYCLAVSDNWIYAEPCSAGRNQQYWFIQDGQYGMGGNTCLTLTGQEATLISCNGDTNQRWTRTNANQLRNQASGLCLTPTRTDGDNVPITASQCTGT